MVDSQGGGQDETAGQVVHHRDDYIRWHICHITNRLKFRNPKVWSLLVFGDQAINYMTQVLVIVEWGTQHWKVGEQNLMPIIPSWMRTVQKVQSSVTVHGKFPLPAAAVSYQDIHLSSHES